MYQLDQIEVALEGELIVPVRELNRMRREAVEKLTGERPKPPIYVKHMIDPLDDAPNTAGKQAKQQVAEPKLTALCRNLEQVEAAVQMNVEMIYADFEFIKQFPVAIEVARRAGKPIALATPRIHMPGENGYHANILKLQPDAVLVRNTGALYYYLRARAENRISLSRD